MQGTRRTPTERPHWEQNLKKGILHRSHVGSEAGPALCAPPSPPGGEGAGARPTIRHAGWPPTHGQKPEVPAHGCPAQGDFEQETHCGPEATKAR